jgi:hypothetical protein
MNQERTTKAKLGDLLGLRCYPPPRRTSPEVFLERFDLGAENMFAKRSTFLLACAFMLGACGAPSGVGSSATPLAPMALHGTYRLAVSGIHRAARGCPSQFVACVTTSEADPATITLCVVSTGLSASCGSATGYYGWTAVPYKGSYFREHPKETKEIGGQNFSPDPGNPTVETITTVQAKASKRNGYFLEVIGCPYTSGNCSPGFIGVTVAS